MGTLELNNSQAHYLIQAHHFHHPRFQMEDFLIPDSHPALVERRPVYHICFQGLVHLVHQSIGYRLPKNGRVRYSSIESERSRETEVRWVTHLQDNRRWYTVTQQFVELPPDLHNLRRCLFRHNQIRHLVTIAFPIGLRYRQRGRVKIFPDHAKIPKNQHQNIAPLPPGGSGTHDCIFNASNTKTAFLMFPFESSAIFSEAFGGKSNPTFLATCCRTAWI